MRILFAICSISLLSIISCNNDCEIIDSFEVDAEGWVYGDSLSFELTAEDTLSQYDLVLELEHNIDFSFQNLYVRSTTHFPSDKSIQDVISLNLGDIAGRWNGECKRSGCTAGILLRSKFRFSELGEHRIVFEQFSREATIEGVKSMKLLLCPSVE